MDNASMILDNQKQLFMKNGFAAFVRYTPILQLIELELDRAVYMAHKQQRPQDFSVLADISLKKDGPLFLKFQYQFHPISQSLKINSIDAYMGNRALRFIPLVEDHLPRLKAMTNYLRNAPRINPRLWAKEFKATPMLMLPGTHKKRRAL